MQIYRQGVLFEEEKMGKNKQLPRIGDIRKIAEDYFIRHGRRLTFRQALLYYQKNGDQYLPSADFVKVDDFLSDNDFMEYIDNGIVFQTDQIIQSGYAGEAYGRKSAPFCIRENDFINTEEDIAVYIHVPYINDGLHSHDHFEINYVYKGTGYFSFSQNGKDRMAAKEGMLCFLAPNIPHNFLASPCSIIISIVLRKTTLTSVFSSLLKREDSISNFFRSCLYKDKYPDYFMVETGNSPEMKRYIQKTVFEFYRMDSYRNANTISVLSMLFSHVMRTCREYAALYDSRDIDGQNEEFAYMLLIQYINQNYSTVTLKTLSEAFHYSESFLSRLIHRQSGKTFSKIVQDCRIMHGKELLESTNIPISRICEIIGYSSPEHFSRIFKREYQVSPSDYRKSIDFSGGNEKGFEEAQNKRHKDCVSFPT